MFSNDFVYEIHRMIRRIFYPVPRGNFYPGSAWAGSSHFGDFTRKDVRLTGRRFRGPRLRWGDRLDTGDPAGALCKMDVGEFSGNPSPELMVRWIVIRLKTSNMCSSGAP